jgi:hypothetical protein
MLHSLIDINEQKLLCREELPGGGGYLPLGLGVETWFPPSANYRRAKKRLVNENLAPDNPLET